MRFFLKRGKGASGANLCAGWLFSVALLLTPCWVQAGSFDDFFHALRNDQVYVLQGLLKRGFDLNTRSESHDPPLIVALREDSTLAATFMLKQPGIDLEATNPKGENALMLAALRGHTDVVKELLQRGAEPNKPGWTALHYAVSYASPEAAKIVTLLLERSAYIDAESPNGTTPLMMAARYGDSQVVRLLLEAGADPSLRNQQGLSAIDFANGVSRPENANWIAQAIRSRAPKGSW